MTATMKGGFTLAVIEKIQALINLTRIQHFPLGVAFMFWPYGIALAMAAYKHSVLPHILLRHTLLFGISVTLFHSAGCIWNDICDRDLDGQVERTKDRPLVTGQVKLSHALALFTVLLLSTLLLVLYINSSSLLYMIIGLPIDFAYPLMKRWTWWPQLGLAIAGVIGCPVTWVSLSPQGLIQSGEVRILSYLSLGFICWIIQADTMYAAQDRKGDELAGIKSTARLFGSSIRMLTSLFGAGFVVFFVLAGISNGNGPAYFVLGCGGAAVHVVYQIISWNPDDILSSHISFKRSHDLGLFIFCAILIDCYII